MTVQLVVENGAFWQQIGREKMLACFEHASAAVLQTDFHLPLQNEHPLRTGGDVKTALKADRAVAQLQALYGQQFAQSGLFSSMIQRNAFLSKTGAPIGVGI